MPPRSRQRLLVRAGTRSALLAFPRGFRKTAGARLGAQKGNTNYTKAEEPWWGRSRIVAYDGFGELVQALVSGDLDAVIIDDVGGQGYVGADAGRLRLLAGALPGQDLAMIFTHGSTLRRPVDAALAAMRADGTLGRMNGTWFSPTFRVPGAPPP